MSTDQHETKSRRRWRPTRRGFLIGTGITAGVAALGVGFGLPALRLTAARMFDGASAPGGATNDPLAWFEIGEDDTITLYVTKVEMGQGVHTAFAQIGAEELGVSLDQLTVRQATTHVGPFDAFGTAGSSSVSGAYQALREAGALLREMLKAEAAVALGQPVTTLVAANGAFAVAADPSQRITYGQVVARKSSWDVPEEIPALKSEAEFSVIGQSAPRVDIPAKVTGQAKYGFDMRVEGMRYGAVARPTTIEAKLISAAPGTALEVPGVEKVVIRDGFAGVVATSRAAARAGLAQMELTWDEGKPWQQAEIEALVAIEDRGGVVIQREGNAPRLLNEAISLSAEYFTPLAAHASLETQAALALVTAEKATVWASTQSQGGTRGDVASALKMSEEQVEVIPTYLGGGFGRKSVTEAGREAAILSQEAGVPVHIGWDRTEEMRNGYFRPPTRSRLFARLDERGRIQALEHRQASGDVLFAFFPSIAADVVGADFGAWRGATIHYGGIPNRQTRAWRSKLPVRTASWRGLGLFANTFAVESFMDELAHLAGQDPLDFRLAHLSDSFNDQRMAAVLRAAAERAGWGDQLPEGRARGIACATDVDTQVALVAEVSMTEGRIRVHKMTAAMDCGLVINPDGAEAQVQGNIIWGVGSTLLEELTVADGRVVPANFDRYPLLTMADAPAIEVILLEAGDGKPRGVGEPAIGPVGAAIANAVFSLTGKRLRQLPFTPERIAAV